MRKRVIGYGVCGKGEASRYMEATLKEFKRLCDDTIILLNNAGKDEKELIEKYGFKWVEDDREWGKSQHKLKRDFVKNHVAPLNPDITICLDMDEVFTSHAQREHFENQLDKGQAWYVYIANLWNDGWSPDWSFWNVRFYGWEWKDKLGDRFFEFEDRPLHCGLAPKWAYHLNLHAPILLKHYGLKEKKDRMRKVERYEKYDPKQIYRAPSYYRALKSDKSVDFNEDLLYRKIIADVDSMKQPLHKELPMIPKKKEYLIKREADGFIFTVPENVLNSQLKQKYKGQGFSLIQKEAVGEVKMQEDDPLTCNVCGYKAESVYELKRHHKNH